MKQENISYEVREYKLRSWEESVVSPLYLCQTAGIVPSGHRHCQLATAVVTIRHSRGSFSSQPW
ncbi:hypothetical protein [uncultured Bacteroides sp.]|uniref:hypothetical protein n=1 Tax=uncultured Bacteroides sp. TaxID=162156 RepID=UPI0025D9CFDA|nr:hypothetical protein [uncultured Bacteroides sp.]